MFFVPLSIFYFSILMVQFDIITIFPDFLKCFTSESLIKRAQEKGLIKINVHNLRDFSPKPHQVVDDRPFGGGFGMVLKVDPFFKAIQAVRLKGKNKKIKIVFFTPRAKKFNQKKAFEFAKLDQIIFLCGRYEGIDERVAKYLVDEKLSVGDYVLLGGELPAMAVIEAVSRLVPGVIGIDKPDILRQRVTEDKSFIEYAQYTRPEVFRPCQRAKRIVSGKPKTWSVPKILLSGNHQEIKKWREKHSKAV